MAPPGLPPGLPAGPGPGHLPDPLTDTRSPLGRVRRTRPDASGTVTTSFTCEYDSHLGNGLVVSDEDHEEEDEETQKCEFDEASCFRPRPEHSARASPLPDPEWDRGLRGKFLWKRSWSQIHVPLF
ncbi:unnamed protein product [Lampetra planeri]